MLRRTTMRWSSFERRLTRFVHKHLKRFFNLRLLSVVVFAVFVMHHFGVFTHIMEEDYYTKFTYHLDIDIPQVIVTLKMGRKVTDVVPVHNHTFNYIFDSAHKCKDELGNFEDVRLLFVIKSAVNHVQLRDAIRQSWGWEQRFSDVQIRTVFILGLSTDPQYPQKDIDAEQVRFKDIVQAEFIDDYYNNTIKTIIGLQWSFNNCPKAQFVFFVDDDYYVSAKNVLRFLRNPSDYPGYLQRYLLAADPDTRLALPRDRDQLRRLHEESDDVDQDTVDLLQVTRLYVGYLIITRPMRHKISKWFVTLEEYPFHMYPPYVTAGAYIMSFDALQDMYFASLYTQMFKFDDVYLGILAKRVGIKPTHNTHFHFYKQWYGPQEYLYTIASHGYADPEELLKVWGEQRTLGNA